MRLLIFTAIILFAPTPLFAQETLPGDSCSAGEVNFIRQSGGPETGGVVHLMRCDGTTWQPYQTFLGDGKAGIGTDTPAAMLDVDGDLRVGTTSDNCSVSKEGAIRYTGGSPPWEYCDGGGPGWLPFETAGSTDIGPADCPNPGDVCLDGSLFVGRHQTLPNYNVFVTDSSPSGGAWSTELIDTGADSSTDGKANQDWIITNTSIINYPAFETCENLSDHGKTDWYLPATWELRLLGAHIPALNPNRTDSIDGNGFHWVSDEASSTAGFRTRPASNAQTDSKSNSYSIECIRKELAG